MKKILLFILGFFIIIFQNTIINYMSIFGITINLVLIYMIVISLNLDELTVGIIGTILGLIVDSSVGAIFGSNALILFFISYIIAFKRRRIYKRSTFVRFEVFTLASFGYYLASFIMANFIFNEYIILSILKLICASLLNGLVGILLYRVFEKPISKLEKE